MGHLFRAKILIEYLKMHNENYIVFINDDQTAKKILRQADIFFEVVDLADLDSEWEVKCIEEYGIRMWINDRLNTEYRHAASVKKTGIPLITFDDRGDGALLADINIAALVFENRQLLQGKKVLTGVEYLILNPEISRYKRLRSGNVERILVSLGGSDTYGVTIKVLKSLKKQGRHASVILGPQFNHWKELESFSVYDFTFKNNVSSLIKEMELYDLAITGGGITPFEANAAGLPCVIIATELHEIEVGRYLGTLGSSAFAGYYEEVEEILLPDAGSIQKMSRIGMSQIPTMGAAKIYEEIIL